MVGRHVRARQRDLAHLPPEPAQRDMGRHRRPDRRPRRHARRRAVGRDPPVRGLPRRHDLDRGESGAIRAEQPGPALPLQLRGGNRDLLPRSGVPGHDHDLVERIDGPRQGLDGQAVGHLDAGFGNRLERHRVGLRQQQPGQRRLVGHAVHPARGRRHDVGGRHLDGRLLWRQVDRGPVEQPARRHHLLGDPSRYPGPEHLVRLEGAPGVRLGRRSHEPQVDPVGRRGPGICRDQDERRRWEW